MKKRLFLTFAPVLVASITLVSACSSSSDNGGGSSTTVSGTVTATDVNAKTFTIRGKDGKDYEFKMVSGSKGDINEIKEHFDRRKEIEVKYRSGNSPLEVVAAD